MARRTKAEIEAARKRSEQAFKYRLKVNFGITPEEYWAIYELQQGHCAILHCHATGKTRRLSVDHDHSCTAGHPPEKGCRKCIRGLVCATHNEWFGRAGDDPDVFNSVIAYLRYPPARAVLVATPSL